MLPKPENPCLSLFPVLAFPSATRPWNTTGTFTWYSYKEWKGTFYPEDLPVKSMLQYYGERLRAVEINNTFYVMPKASVLETWSAEVPEDFQFVLKASRRITHMQRLKDVEESVACLLDVAGTLKEQLGPLLFQLPPNLKKDAPRLRAFLVYSQTPDRCVALEFRYQSWFDDEVFETMRSSICYGSIRCSFALPKRKMQLRFPSFLPQIGDTCVCAGRTMVILSSVRGAGASASRTGAMHSSSSNTAVPQEYCIDVDLRVEFSGQ